MKRVWIAGLALLAVSACRTKEELPTKPDQPVAQQTAPMGAKYALIKTTKGDISVKLFGDKAPNTVANFIALATGAKTWRDPRDGQEKKNTPLYDGVLFHRVIPGFMAQTGDPRGDGMGNPGYRFGDEFDPTLRYDRPGLLGMANTGPDSNGCQFFITVVPTPHLNDHHTIFGEVIKGQDVVDKIVSVPRDENDRPLEPVKIVTIKISDQAPN
jgi:peptidyl-prolyl cis-trans isomerase A (cyclophilin A)